MLWLYILPHHHGALWSPHVLTHIYHIHTHGQTHRHTFTDTIYPNRLRIPFLFRATETWPGPPEEASRKVWYRKCCLPTLPGKIRHPSDILNRRASTIFSPCSVFSNCGHSRSLNSWVPPWAPKALKNLITARPAAGVVERTLDSKSGLGAQTPVLSPPRWLQSFKDNLVIIHIWVYVHKH